MFHKHQKLYILSYGTPQAFCIVKILGTTTIIAQKHTAVAVKKVKFPIDSKPIFRLII